MGEWGSQRIRLENGQIVLIEEDSRDKKSIHPITKGNVEKTMSDGIERRELFVKKAEEDLAKEKSELEKLKDFVQIAEKYLSQIDKEK